jgi:hypothetical protein
MRKLYMVICRHRATLHCKEIPHAYRLLQAEQDDGKDAAAAPRGPPTEPVPHYDPQLHALLHVMQLAEVETALGPLSGRRRGPECGQRQGCGAVPSELLTPRTSWKTLRAYSWWSKPCLGCSWRAKEHGEERSVLAGSWPPLGLWTIKTGCGRCCVHRFRYAHSSRPSEPRSSIRRDSARHPATIATDAPHSAPAL